MEPPAGRQVTASAPIRHPESRRVLRGREFGELRPGARAFGDRARSSLGSRLGTRRSRAEYRTVVPDPGARVHVAGRRLNDDKVDAKGQPRNPSTVRQGDLGEETADRPPQACPLSPVERLFGQTVLPASAPADLDDDEHPRRAGIHGHDVQLTVAGSNIPGEHVPTGIRQESDDELFSRPAGTRRS